MLGDLQRLAPRHREQEARDLHAAQRRVERGAVGTVQRVLGAEALADLVQVADDDAEEVVEVVGEAAGELPDRLQLLPLVDLLLDAHRLRDVPERPGDLDGVAAGVAHERGLVLHPPVAAVAAAEAEARALLAGLLELLAADPRALGVVGMDAALPEAGIGEEMLGRPAGLRRDVAADEAGQEGRGVERVEDGGARVQEPREEGVELVDLLRAARQLGRPFADACLEQLVRLGQKRRALAVAPCLALRQDHDGDEREAHAERRQDMHGPFGAILLERLVDGDLRREHEPVLGEPVEAVDASAPALGRRAMEIAVGRHRPGDEG